MTAWTLRRLKESARRVQNEADLIESISDALENAGQHRESKHLMKVAVRLHEAIGNIEGN